MNGRRLTSVLGTRRRLNKESFWDSQPNGRKSQIRELFLEAKVRGFWDSRRALPVL